jgi:hypothetical protein
MAILVKIWCKYMAIENLKKHTVSIARQKNAEEGANTFHLLCLSLSLCFVCAFL